MNGNTVGALRRAIIQMFPALTLLALLDASAQPPGYRVGDRVMASPSSLQDEKYWRPCTVTQVFEFVPRRAYALACDATQASSAGSFTVNEQWIRPAGGSDIAAPSRSAAQAPPVATRSAEKAIAGNVACPASDADNHGGNGLEQSFRAAIRQAFERRAAAGADGAVTVTFDNLSIGQAHAYRVYADPDEAKGKTIYPVRATFTTCTDYARRIVLVKRQRAFSCYASAPGEWACDIVAAANTNVRDETNSIDKPR